MNDERHEIRVLLRDIAYWGERLKNHLTHLSEEQFVADDLRCDAVCWCIICIGEAAGRLRKLDADMVSTYPELDLISAYAMRNRLAHGYAMLDLGILWHSANVSVPQLVAAAEAALDAF